MYIYIYIGCSKKNNTENVIRTNKSLLVLHVCARYKDYYIIILGANIIYYVNKTILSQY